MVTAAVLAQTIVNEGPSLVSTVLVAVMSSLISGGLVLAGVRLSNANERSRQRELLKEQALSGQRDLVVAITSTGRSWKDQQFLMLAVLSQIMKGDTSTTMVELADTETMERLGQTNEALKLALAKGRLFIAQSDLLTAARGLSQFVDGFSELAIGPVMEAKGDTAVLAECLGRLNGFGAALDDFETLAAKELRSLIWDA